MTTRRLTALGVLGLALCAVSVAVAQADPIHAGREAQVTVAVLTIAALLGDENQWVTGQRIEASGGMHL